MKKDISKLNPHQICILATKENAEFIFPLLVRLGGDVGRRDISKLPALNGYYYMIDKDSNLIYGYDVSRDKTKLTLSELQEYVNVFLEGVKETQTDELLILKNKITELQEKYDENGYNSTHEIKLNRIEQQIDSTINIYQSELSAVKKENESLKKELSVVSDEREALIKAYDKIRAEFEGREWLMEGRGTYPYNDDRYKQEVRYIMDAFNKISKDLWKQINSKSFEYRNSIEAPLKQERDELRECLKDVKDHFSDGDENTLEALLIKIDNLLK